MFKNKGYPFQRLLISFTTILVVLILISVFVSYTPGVTRDARINMLKITKMQLMSTNRLLLSRSKILNIQLLAEVDASILDDAYQGGRLTWGQMLATKDNIPIFVRMNQLRLDNTDIPGKIIIYPKGLKGVLCLLEYNQPAMHYNEQGKPVYQAAHYRLRTKHC